MVNFVIEINGNKLPISTLDEARELLADASDIYSLLIKGNKAGDSNDDEEHEENLNDAINAVIQEFLEGFVKCSVSNKKDEKKA